MQLNDMSFYIFNHLKKNLIRFVHAHEILNESSSKVPIYFSSGDTDVTLVALAYLCEYEKRNYIINSHGQHNKKHKTKQYDLCR